MQIKNTEKVMRLFDVVTNDMLCAWSIFLSNVEAEGWTGAMLLQEAEKCASKEDFVRLANKFI
jgi:hypothetical protein